MWIFIQILFACFILLALKLGTVFGVLLSMAGLIVIMQIGKF